MHFTGLEYPITEKTYFVTDIQKYLYTMIAKHIHSVHPNIGIDNIVQNSTYYAIYNVCPYT